MTINKRSDATWQVIVVYGRLQGDERRFQKRFWQALGDAKFTADGKSDKNDAKALNEMGGLKDALMKGAQAVKPATISLIILQSYAVHGQ